MNDFLSILRAAARWAHDTVRACWSSPAPVATWRRVKLPPLSTPGIYVVTSDGIHAVSADNFYTVTADTP